MAKRHRGYIILVGHVCTPMRVTDEDGAVGDVAWFVSREKAEQWIAEHPKAKFPQVVALESYA